MRSGLGTVKRDWSANKSEDNKPSNPDPSLRSVWSLPTPPSEPASQSSKSRLDGLQASLSDGIASSEKLLSSSRSSQKRAAEPSDSVSGPPAKKRVLPASFSTGPQPAKTISRTSSLNSKSWGSFAYPKQNTSSLTRTSTHSAPGSSSKSSASISLSQEQNHILKLAQEGRSLFYTGSAGTGKSVLLREIIKALRKKYVSIPDAVAVTASTGTLNFLVRGCNTNPT